MSSHLTDEDFDRALNQRNDSIRPSSGFADSVMAAVALGDVTPPAIAFPWKQALPGVAAGACVVILLAAAFAVAFRVWELSASVSADLRTSLDVVSTGLIATDARLMLIAPFVTAACLALTRRLLLPQR